MFGHTEAHFCKSAQATCSVKRLHNKCGGSVTSSPTIYTIVWLFFNSLRSRSPLDQLPYGLPCSLAFTQNEKALAPSIPLCPSGVSERGNFVCERFFLPWAVLFFSSPAKTTGCCQVQCKWEYTYSGREGGRGWREGENERGRGHLGFK